MSDGFTLFSLLAFPFLLAPVVAAWGGRLGSRTGWLALAAPVVSLLGVLRLLAGGGAEPPVMGWSWMPALGVNLHFRPDGLGLFFALVVSGMGALIFFYATHYLDDAHARDHGRFYTYLCLFMGSMLGAVLADDLLVLFVFWELTSVTSFLLIGFLHGEEASRVGARQALLVTGTTGLCLLAGVVLLHQVTGTWSWSEMAREGLPWAEHPGLLGGALVLLALGAFGKSAQFPFQFWLPNAMTAPTPVSAYLHSATMVKLGVFWSARLFPLFATSDLWAPLLGGIGFTTMLIGAAFALVSHDLKAILAWSTVSALGSLIGYYGLGEAGGVAYDYLHIASHVLYKGCLFMVVGVVSHATGERDLRRLGGLGRRLPWLGLTALLACASMAGLPGTLGFISKEALLKEGLAAPSRLGGLGTYALTCLLLASALKVAFSLRLYLRLFRGPEPTSLAAHFHAPSFALQLPPLLLAAGALLLGVYPAALEGLFHRVAVPGLHTAGEHLALWHGPTRELAFSALVVLIGVGLYAVGRSAFDRQAIPTPARFDLGFEAGLRAVGDFARWLTRITRVDRPADYLLVIIGFTLCMVFGVMTTAALRQDSVDWLELLGRLPPVRPLPLFLAGIIATAVIAVVVLERWTSQLICLSSAGFLICCYFVLYHAPDLALTQILVEVITLFLILILLGRFPLTAERGEGNKPLGPGRKALHWTVAGLVGLGMTLLLLLADAQPATERLGDLVLQATVPLAHGTNAVNTILVDFRGFDTLGEISVLVIATLGCLGLLMRYKRSAEEYQAGPLDPPGFGTDDPEEEAREKP
jgi:multicomponent K+:H+ antiporter subunit A/multicomponent Na+:H+ antiporter subunit A